MKTRYLFYFLVMILLQNCSPARMAGVPSHLEDRVGQIWFYSDSSPLDGTYEVLGTVKGQYHPITGIKEIEWNLKMQAYSAWGSEAHAIIRVYSTAITTRTNPLGFEDEFRGTVIRFK